MKYATQSMYLNDHINLSEHEPSKKYVYFEWFDTTVTGTKWVNVTESCIKAEASQVQVVCKAQEKKTKNPQ